jgi:uncharacterized protein YndB with AHSA1/START domain
MSDVDEMVVEVTQRFAAPPVRVWDLLSDVERMAGLGPEHVEAHWEDPGPALGARFSGRNVREGRDWAVGCRVVACDRPSRFGWIVGNPAEPSAEWLYELASDGDGTLVTQRFRHGPGFSYLRRQAEKYPDRAAQVVADRATELAANMRAALTAADALL